MNIQWTQLSNLWAENNPRWFDMQLKSINQSTYLHCHYCNVSDIIASNSLIDVFFLSRKYEFLRFHYKIDCSFPIGNLKLVFLTHHWISPGIDIWIPKTQKMVLDVALLNTQHYKVRTKGQVEQSREWSSALLNTSVW